jgi:hypothetical protein
MFVTGLTTDVDDEASRHTLGTVGGQLDLRFTVLSNLDMTLSAGAALAFEQGVRARREAMISLKVLR